MNSRAVVGKRLTRMKGLRDHRQAAKVSQETLARHSGVSTMSIRRYEAGSRVMPPPVAVKMVRALHQMGVTRANPVDLVLTTARDVAATKSIAGARDAIGVLGALKVDARPDAATAALIDAVISALAELRGQAYQHGRFSNSEGPAELDVPFPVRIDDRRAPLLDTGNVAGVGAPQTPPGSQTFGMKRRAERDGFGRSRRKGA
ncbi:MAG: helix-turn-helix domain-containing protein [Dehalococcoidia bacterium]|nr:helix-turn-helix domain-containing protein [Dehalococcoidia bacterium]